MNKVMGYGEILLRHTYTTRWIFTGMSSHMYYKDWSTDDLLAELAKEAIEAFENGVCDPWLNNIACPLPQPCFLSLG